MKLVVNSRYCKIPEGIDLSKLEVIISIRLSFHQSKENVPDTVPDMLDYLMASKEPRLWHLYLIKKYA